MESRYPKQYQTALSELRRDFGGDKICRLLDYYVDKANHELTRAHSTNYDKEKVFAIDALAKWFVEGLREGKDTSGNCGIQKTAQIFVNLYGSAFNAGVCKIFNRTTFNTKLPNNSQTAGLEIIAGNGFLNLLIDYYQDAIRKKIVRTPRDFEVTFGFGSPYIYSPPFSRVHIHRKMFMRTEIC